ncbi:N-acetylmuramoyl-L-alanine amidase [Stenotrophomonas oahuensis]|uniref:N-acetylmuramoyl-L-alanine amidase n=1 Tax=Stenotrophomonas oahuensis TaxID=3003271 RepID=A0ABY9YMY7_9GAMM|nr:N-acetylmuramoyl-L-alanine amidase [Stenotrophomonas sp. A5586]WNH51976.1 N-acetylmuramoyl-L-alanine amidase [Stenotrophomonas sp. A5586]
MINKIPRLGAGNRALILGVTLAVSSAANAQTFGYEESESSAEQARDVAITKDHKDGGSQQRQAAVMAGDVRKEERAPAVTESPDVSRTPATALIDNDSEFDAIVTQVARQAVDRVALLDGQSRSRVVAASVDLVQRFVIVRLDAGFVPATYGPAFEDQVSLINNAILHVAEKVEPLRGVKYLYGGYDIHHYFPEIKAADDKARRAGELRRMAEESRAARREAAAASDGNVDKELIHLLEREASRKVSAHVQANNVLRVIGVKVTIDVSRQRILADIGEGYRPEPDGDEMFLQELAVTLRHHTEKTGLAISGVDIHFQGKPLEYYYPDELRVPEQALRRSVNQSALVSSGHGLVRVHPHLSWEWQRPDAFGSREDMITPPFGDELQRLLEARSGLTVHRARSRSLDLHPESDRPWEQMSSRYHLKDVLPQRADIWNSLPNDMNNDREVREDIRARPLYANHLDAGTMISLHTNGHETNVPRGLEVYYHFSKAQDRPLAESVLCNMREIIRAQPGYEQFPVRNTASDGRHGENRIATMPSVLVEIAYHSNPDDFAALQDPVFRTASMKGVEKGVRLFREGKVCEPFKLNRLPDVSMVVGSSQELPMTFLGNPQYPVTMEFTIANCSTPGACKATQTVFDDPAEPIKANMRCRGVLAGIARWSVVLRDVDGVVTAPVEFQQTCHKPGAA